MEEHIHEHVQQVAKMLMASLNIKTGGLFAREGVHMSAKTLHRLGDLPGGSP
jgi:hypothetical protein